MKKISLALAVAAALAPAAASAADPVRYCYFGGTICFPFPLPTR